MYFTVNWKTEVFVAWLFPVPLLLYSFHRLCFLVLLVHHCGNCKLATTIYTQLSVDRAFHLSVFHFVLLHLSENDYETSGMVLERAMKRRLLLRWA